MVNGVLDSSRISCAPRNSTGQWPQASQNDSRWRARGADRRVSGRLSAAGFPVRSASRMTARSSRRRRRGTGRDDGCGRRRRAFLCRRGCGRHRLEGAGGQCVRSRRQGGRPARISDVAGVPGSAAPRWLEGVRARACGAQAAFGYHLAGGDTDRRPGRSAITITAIGRVPAGAHGAPPTAHAGTRLRVRHARRCDARARAAPRSGAAPQRCGLDARGARGLDARYLRARSRRRAGAGCAPYASAAMDISDGLAKDSAACAAHGVGGCIAVPRVPLSDAARAVVAAATRRFGESIIGGEDYEVLAAVSRPRAADSSAWRRRPASSVTRSASSTTADGLLSLSRWPALRCHRGSGLGSLSAARCDLNSRLTATKSHRATACSRPYNQRRSRLGLAIS